jgi:hypothetical protein
MAAAMTEAITEILTQIDRIVDILRKDDRGNTPVVLSTHQAQSKSFLKALDRAYENIHDHPPNGGNTNTVRLELLLILLTRIHCHRPNCLASLQIHSRGSEAHFNENPRNGSEYGPEIVCQDFWPRNFEGLQAACLQQH